MACCPPESYPQNTMWLGPVRSAWFLVVRYHTYTSGALVLVDVNFFPSYTGVPGVAASIHSELLQIARQNGKERATFTRGENE